jgi:hypothetical protein
MRADREGIPQQDITVKKQEYSLRIQDLLRVSFGYKKLYYLPILDRSLKGEKKKYSGLQALDAGFGAEKSYLNTPIMMPLKVQISKKGEELEYYTLPNEPIVEIRSAKRIVETDIDGQNGSFKELYSLGDYQITIRGVAVDENYDNENYPEDIVRSLRTINELPHHLEVVGPLFTLFNIKYIAIKEFNLVPNPGEQSMVPYEFICLSDKEYQLELKRKTANE